jgi:hypothetical protein
MDSLNVWLDLDPRKKWGMAGAAGIHNTNYAIQKCLRRNQTRIENHGHVV